MLDLVFVNETRNKLKEKDFEDVWKNFQKVLKKNIDKKIGKRKGSVDLVIVSDKKIQDMNDEYRDKNEPTDVIAFAYLEVTDYKNMKGEIVVGDIFISVDTAKRQAKERGLKLEEELKTLFVHGLLHLFGFDHKTKKEETEMEKWATKIL